MTRPARKREIENLRQEGRDAYDAWESIHSNPYRDTNADHWRHGWQQREFEVQQAEKAQGPQTPEEMQERIVEWLRESCWVTGANTAACKALADAIENGEHLL